MTHPTSLDLGSKALFLTASPEFNEEMIETYLTNHLNNAGFPVGVYHVDQLTQEEFADIRANTFGASDSSVLLEVAYSSSKVPMKTVDELIYEKVNKVWDEEIGKKASVRKGRELEPIILDKISYNINATVIKPKHMYINQKGLATNFDGVVLENISTDDNLSDNFIPVPMEVKLCSFFGRANYNWSKGIHQDDALIMERLQANTTYQLINKHPIHRHVEHAANLIGIPKYYYTQVQQQMYFLNAPHGYLAVMDDINWTLYYYKIPRDQFMIDYLIDKSMTQYARLSNKKDL